MVKNHAVEVRYADDLLILCKSQQNAERALRNIFSFVEDKLVLKANKERKNVMYNSETKFLGYTFYRYKGKGRLQPIHRVSKG